MRTFFLFVIMIILGGMADDVERIADALDRAYPKVFK